MLSLFSSKTKMRMITFLFVCLQIHAFPPPPFSAGSVMAHLVSEGSSTMSTYFMTIMADIHTYTYRHTYTHTSARARALTHTHTQHTINTHSHTHTQHTHIHAHTFTLTHTH